MSFQSEGFSSSALMMKVGQPDLSSDILSCLGLFLSGLKSNCEEAFIDYRFQRGHIKSFASFFLFVLRVLNMKWDKKKKAM